jgi:aryl-alcohol dehydrogenase-like predicted oxidoreductase
MRYRKLGNTDLTISELGFGCQSIGGGIYYKNDKESLITLTEAFDAGVNFFDTSDHYSLGESEKLVGKAFKGKRDRVILATKAGTLYSQSAFVALRIRPLIRPFGKYLKSLKIPFHLMRAKQKRKDFSSAYLTEAVERSLKNLQTDYIDLFQLHKPPKDELEKGEFNEALESLKQQGKIRYYGIATAENDEAFICFNYPGISSLQITFNLLDHKHVQEILAQAKEKGVGIISRNPRAQGHLTKEFSDIMAETYAKDVEEFERKKERAKKFNFLVKENRTLAQSALHYVLSHEGISTALPRSVNSEQLKESLGILNAPPLTDSELLKIKSMQPKD